MFDKELKNLGQNKLDVSSYTINRDKIDHSISQFAEELDKCRV